MYNVSDLSVRSLALLWQRMQTDANLMAAYVTSYSVRYGSSYDYINFLCDMRFIDQHRNDECVRTGRLDRWQRKLNFNSSFFQQKKFFYWFRSIKF